MSNATTLVRSFESQAKAAIPRIDRLRQSPSGFVGIDLTNENRELYSHFKNWVYVAVNAISTRVASQGVLAGEMLDATPNPMRSAFVTKDMTDRMRTKASLHEVNLIRNHPVIDLIQKPNAVQNRYQFLYTSAANILITGEAYWIYGDVDGEVEAWAVPTCYMTALHENGLFTGYLYKPPGTLKGIPFTPEQVTRAYLPDPRNLKCAMSPLMAIIGSSQSDHNLQTSQQEMFSRGIHPNLMITVGRNRGADGKLTDRRPVLTGFHRRQLIKSVREIWGNTVNRGDPAIIDGLIESVHKLQATPQEMDFLSSGETLKNRIMQAYAVNPIVLGEIGDANRATAIQAEKMFITQAVNPIVDIFSEALTESFGPLYSEPARLLVWIEKAKALDPELELERWREARKNGDVTRNEWRTHILNLPPVPDTVERNLLLSGTGGMQATMLILMAVSKGEMDRDQAKNMLMLFLEIEERLAEELVGDGSFLEGDSEEVDVVEQITAAEQRAITFAQEKIAELESDYASDLHRIEKQSKDELDKEFADRKDAAKQLAEMCESVRAKVTSTLEKLESIASMSAIAEQLTKRVSDGDENTRSLVKSMTEGSHDALIEISKVLQEQANRAIEITNDIKVPEQKLPDIKMDAPVVNVEAPVINIDPPDVIVEAAQIKFEPRIDVDVPETNVTVQSLQGEIQVSGKPRSH